MYADRNRSSSTLDPRSLTIAVAVNGAALAALLLASPTFKVISHERPFVTYPVAKTPPPEPPPPQAPNQPRVAHQPIVAQKPIVVLPIQPPPVDTTDLVLPRPVPSADPGPTVLPLPTPSPALVTIAATIDPAHRGDLQPDYPASELRAEREGVVTVRVLIGVDGRVHAVERVAATTDDFLRATQERALARWRFRPATRGGIPIEDWRQMTIRFVIPR